MTHIRVFVGEQRDGGSHIPERVEGLRDVIMVALHGKQPLSSGIEKQLPTTIVSMKLTGRVGGSLHRAACSGH